MSLWDIFTGDPAIEAAEKNKALLQQTQGNILGGNATASTQISDLLKAGYGQGRTDLGQGYGAATGAINAGAGGALGYLDQGTTGAVNALTANGGAYAGLGDLAARYGQGANLYADALGINGAGGNQRAVSAYQTGPGYTAGLDTGLDAITRHANAAGGLGGNSLRDTFKFGVDYSNQGYDKYLDRLSGFNPLELSATQGAAAGNQSNNTAIAGLINSGGINKAGVATGQAGKLADIASQYYGGLANNSVGGAGAEGSNLAHWQDANNSAQLNITPQITGQNTAAANAEMQGSANIWGLGLNLAKLGAGVNWGGLSWGGGDVLPGGKPLGQGGIGHA